MGRLERKHGRPLSSISGVVYVIHYGEPVTARSTSADYPAGPIDHYVGWTKQRYPFRRVLAHHPPTAHLSVSLHPGTLDIEERVKSLGGLPHV